ncbi:OmpA family protein [Litorisediminicola beolgyonensis]|uniref:OmpA family protein n=1 Tax=Litorisediminicola beolgyonensis TaxID=1173614 RepID=A0ABW3ZCW1_9RHOB
MRLSSLSILAGTFLAAAGLSVVAASVVARMVEESSLLSVANAMEREGLDWVELDANGLQVFVIGTAPTEADRFRAISVAGRIVDAARVIDETQTQEAERIRPPEFSIELLRNDKGLSLIGLVPAAFDRERLLEDLRSEIGQDAEISDFLETADFPEPEHWQDSIDMALRALDAFDRAKISVAAGDVLVKAMAESAAGRRQIERDLQAARPDAVRLSLDIAAPRPVITPFSLRFVLDEVGPHFDACAADSESAQAQIRAAATRAGVTGTPGCVIGLGVPAPSWGSAAAMAIDALTEIGGGSVTFSNADVSFVAAEGTPPELFDEVVGKLENALPAPFLLDAVLPQPPEAPTDLGPPEFTASLSPEGLVQLRGRIASEKARETAATYARARFASDSVTMGARVDETLNASWQARVLAGIEALARLNSGAVTVTPDEIAVTGKTGNTEASAEIATLLSDQLGSDTYDINVEYVEKLDPSLGIPPPEECVKQIREIVGARKITFEPGSATLDPSADEILDGIAELLKLCGEFPLEIQGHTDSQGREIMNQQLSQQRAESVLTALRDRRVLTAAYRARGYGEERPIASNESEDGREQNRRIEFRLYEEQSAEAAADGDAEQERPANE